MGSRFYMHGYRGRGGADTGVNARGVTDRAFEFRDPD